MCTYLQKASTSDNPADRAAGAAIAATTTVSMYSSEILLLGNFGLLHTSSELLPHRLSKVDRLVVVDKRIVR